MASISSWAYALLSLSSDSCSLHHSDMQDLSQEIETHRNRGLAGSVPMSSWDLRFAGAQDGYLA